MAGSHVEIPGYDYDPQLNRYYKRTGNGTFLPSKPTKITDQPKKTTRLKRNSHYNLLSFIESRNTQLECSDYTDRLIEELTIPYYKPDIEASESINKAIKAIINSIDTHGRSYHTIKDIKINGSGHYLALSMLYENKLEMSTVAKQPIILHLRTLSNGELTVEVMNVDNNLPVISSHRVDVFLRHHFSNFFKKKINGTKMTTIDSFDFRNGKFLLSTNMSITPFHEVHLGPVKRIHHVVGNDHHGNYRRGRQVSAIGSDHHGNYRIGETEGVCKMKEDERRVHVFCRETVTAIGDFQQFHKTCFGYKNGKVVIYKHEDNSNTQITAIKSTIVGLHPYHHDNNIVISAMKSKLESWDLDTNRRVLKFSDHSNLFSHLSSFIDTRDRILTAVSDTRVIHSWSLSDGRLLHSFPKTSFDKGASHFLPIICHTYSLGGCYGYPAMIVARGENFVIYRIQ